MSKTYRVIPFVFDMKAFSDALKVLPEDEISRFAEILGVHSSTLRNWRNNAHRNTLFPYPNMTNFLTVCNLLDLDPRNFFVLAEG